MELDPSQLVRTLDDLKPWGDVLSGLVRYGVPFVTTTARYFRDRYKYDSDETRRQAALAASNTVELVVQRLADNVRLGKTTEEVISFRLEQPALVKSVQDRLIAASEAADPFTQEELAALIAERITTDPTSRRSLMLRLASERVTQITGRQAKLLGLTYAIQHVWVLDPDPRNIKLEQLGKWQETLEEILAPFDVEPDPIDFRHLAEVGFVTVTEWGDEAFANPSRETGSGSRLLDPLPWLGLSFPVEQWTPAVRRAWRMYRSREDDNIPIGAVLLTQLGFIAGVMAYSILHDEDFELSEAWNEPELDPPNSANQTDA